MRLMHKVKIATLFNVVFFIVFKKKGNLFLVPL